MSRFPRTLSILFLLCGAVAAQTPDSGPLEFGTATGRPGEVVRVPVRITIEHPLIFLFVPFEYDAGRLRYLRFEAGGAVAAFDPTAIGYGERSPGVATFIMTESGTSYRNWDRVPAGERQPIGDLVFAIPASAEAGEAAVTPVEGVSWTASGIQCSLDLGDGQTAAFHPHPLVGGSALVQAPQGPRPVGDFACRQYLDRAKLSFTTTETYDSIRISRDGVSIATLPGDATGYEDPLPGVGAYRYAAVAVKGGDESIAVACDLLAVSPAAPPVEDFTCGDQGLAWSSPVAYERIAVFRNGEQVADLPGDAVAWTDPARPEGLTVYGVAGDLEGFRGPEVNCLDHGAFIMEVGDVQVPLDAKKILVPIYVTLSRPMQGMAFHLEIPLDRLEYIEDVEGMLEGSEGYPKPEKIIAGGISSFFNVPAAVIVWDHNLPMQPEKDFPVCLRHRAINFVFEVKGVFSEGEVLPLRLLDGDLMLRGCVSQEIDLYVPGQVRFGNAGPEGVKDLHCQVSPNGAGGGAAGSEVTLAWENGAPYDSIRIERNGVSIGEIPGDHTSYGDAAVPRGIFTYKVIGVSNGSESFPATAFLSTLAPRDAFLRCDANRDGRIDFADPVFTLEFLFRGGSPSPCEDAADADDDGALGLTDAIVAIRYLFLGAGVIRAPGTRYPWFDPTPDSLGCRD
jgi:hypothetical protein